MMRVVVGVKIPRRSASYVWDTNPRKFKLFYVVTAVDDACAQRHKTVGAKRIYTTLEQQGGSRGVYFQKFNPLLFAGLSLPRTKIGPKHNERVV